MSLAIHMIDFELLMLSNSTTLFNHIFQLHFLISIECDPNSTFRWSSEFIRVEFMITEMAENAMDTIRIQLGGADVT